MASSSSSSSEHASGPKAKYVDSYPVFIEKAKALYSRVTSGLAKLKPMWVGIDQNYRIDSGTIRGNGALASFLRAEEGAPESWQWFEIESCPAGKDIVARHWFAPRQGIAIIMDVFSKNDVGKKKFWPSDISHQCWRRAAMEANGVDPASLRIIGVDTILNKATKMAIWRAQRWSTCVQNRFGIDDGTLPDRGYRVYSDLDDGFFAILRSPLGMIVARCLEERHHLLHSIVEKIVVLGLPDDMDIDDFLQGRKIYFVLKKIA